MLAKDYETVKRRQEGGVAILTLSRPEAMNAFNTQMMADLLASIDDVDGDDSVKVVIVTGEGRAFCAGADLSGGGNTFDRSRPRDPRREVGQVDGVNRDGGGRVTMRLFNCSKPIIAAVNGAAVGVGVTMQLAMDIRLASYGAKFGFVFARRGVVPESAAGWFLPRLVGLQTAAEWMYTGRVFSAAEALDKRLVRSLHEADDLMPAALELAHEIADNAAPVSLALTRQMLWRGLTLDHPMEMHKVDSRAMHFRGSSADAKEGISSFLEKRPAIFSDKVSTDIPQVWLEWNERSFR